MRRDARTATLVALVTLAIALAETTALTRRPPRADTRHMSKTTDMQNAMWDLQPGALIAFNALQGRSRLVEVVNFNPDRPMLALSGLDVGRDDARMTLNLGQVMRGWTVVQRAPRVPSQPNEFSEADRELLRSRADQRG